MQDRTDDLYIAMYVSSAHDYVRAYLQNDVGQMNVERLFMESGTGNFSPDFTARLPGMLENEVHIAMNVANKFIREETTTIPVNQQKCVPWILREVLKHKFPKQAKLQSKTHPNGKTTYKLVKCNVV